MKHTAVNWHFLTQFVVLLNFSYSKATVVSGNPDRKLNFSDVTGLTNCYQSRLASNINNHLEK